MLREKAKYGILTAVTGLLAVILMSSSVLGQEGQSDQSKEDMRPKKPRTKVETTVIPDGQVTTPGQAGPVIAPSDQSKEDMRPKPPAQGGGLLVRPIRPGGTTRPLPPVQLVPPDRQNANTAPPAGWPTEPARPGTDIQRGDRTGRPLAPDRPGVYFPPRTPAEPQPERITPGGDRLSVMPDLWVKTLELSNRKPHIGQEVRVLAVIVNRSPQGLEGAKVRFYLGRQPIGKDQIIGIPALGKEIVTIVFWPKQEGTWPFIAAVDPDNELAEADERNNRLAEEIEVLAPTETARGEERPAPEAEARPAPADATRGLDLYVKSLELSNTQPSVEDTVQVKAVIGNRGQRAVREAHVQFYIRGNPFGKGCDMNLDPLGEAEATTEIGPEMLAMINKRPGGRADVTVKVDPFNEMGDINRENNVATARLVVALAPAAPKDMKVEHPDLKPAPQPPPPAPLPTEGPGYHPTDKYWSGGLYPYFRSDTKYTSWIGAANRSAYTIDITVSFRDAKGALVDAWKQPLGPFQCHRFTKASFLGSVYIEGRGEKDAIHSMLEMRANAGNGVALAEPARPPYEWGVPWFFHLGVKDEGPKKVRTTLATYNGGETPLDVEYGLGWEVCTIKGKQDYVPIKLVKAKIPSRGLHFLMPYDEIDKPYEREVYVGWAGEAMLPGVDFTGAQFLETGQDIGLLNYKPARTPLTSSKHALEQYNLYFAGVKYDGLTRTDTIFIKNNENSNKTKLYPVHFYDKSGNEFKQTAATVVKLEADFGHPYSSAAICPMKMLATSFDGSVWIETPTTDERLEAMIRRQAPLKWAALSDVSPGWPMGYNVIPYVSSKDPNWIYQVILFYPAANYKKTPAPPQDKSVIFGGPNVTIPPVAGKEGWIVMRFHQMSGQFVGWMLIKFNPNETQYHTINSLVSQYIKEPFEGSIEIEPRETVTQLEVRSKDDYYHGFTGNWYGTLTP